MGAVQNLFITLLLFSGIIIGIGSFMAETSTNYGKSYTYQGRDIRSLNATVATQEQVNTLKSSVDNTQPSLISFVDVLATGVFTVLKLTLAVPNIFSSLLSDLTGIVGFPAWVFGTFMGIITVIVIFAIIKAVTKTEV